MKNGKLLCDFLLLKCGNANLHLKLNCSRFTLRFSLATLDGTHAHSNAVKLN